MSVNCYLTEKRNGYLRIKWLLTGVALTRSSRHERVDCILFLATTKLTCLRVQLKANYKVVRLARLLMVLFLISPITFTH